LGVEIAPLFASGFVTYTIRAISTVFVSVITDVITAAEAVSQMRVISTVASGILTAFKGTSAGKVLKFISTVSEVIAVIGVLLDTILAIIAAVEGAKQREDLQKAIKDLFPRRLLSKVYQMQATAITLAQDQVYSYLAAVDSGAKPEELKPLQDKIANDIKKDIDAITLDKANDELTHLDARGSWRDDDPTYKEALAYIEKLE